MIKLADYRTEKALPAEMRTPERIALAYAYDRQKKKFLERVKRVYIWADLDQVDDRNLDFLAVENRVPFYNTDLAPDIKRNLIKNSIYWHMKFGTRQAMEEVISAFCNDEKVVVEEWYIYGGEPFHFRVFINIEGKGINIDVEDLIKRINRYKRAAARLDSVDIKKVKRIGLYTASGKEVFVRLQVGINPYCKKVDKRIKTYTNSGNLRHIKINYHKGQVV